MVKPQAKDLSRFFSDEAASRKPSLLKAAFINARRPGMLSLGGGLPLPDLFPWDDLRIKSLAAPFADGNDIDILTAKDVVETSVDKKSGTNKEDCTLQVSLQYGQSTGDIHLREYIIEHTKICHDIGIEDWDIAVTCGNTWAWDAVLRTFCNRGDVILAEEFTFSSALEAARAQGVTTVGVKMDLDGIIPEALDLQLTNWAGSKPKFLYTIPTGQNPTGSSLSAERREAVYKIAQKHDILIIEDEPYYYLQMPEYKYGNKTTEKMSHDAFIKSLVPSYLTYDTDGRVLRLDSFSKVLAPGTRIGWVVGSKQMVERISRLIEVSSQNVSGFSTTIVNGLLQRWGQAGYLDWLIELRHTYTHKRDIVCDAIMDYLPKGSFELSAPVAGMFFWLKFDARRHKKYAEFHGDVKKIEMEMYEEGLGEFVQLAPGQWFWSNQETTPAQPEVPRTEDEKNAIYYRGTFASVPGADLVEAIKRFSTVVKKNYE